MIILIIITSIEFLKEWSRDRVDEIQKDTEEGKRLLTLRNLFRKIKKKKKRKKRSNATQAMQYFLPSKTSQQG